MADKDKDKSFDWGAVFQVIGIGINAGANIHAANKNVELAKNNNSFQLQQAGNQRFNSILAAMTEQRKNSSMPMIMIAIVVVALVLLFYLKK